jgi:hypothetical protein
MNNWREARGLESDGGPCTMAHRFLAPIAHLLIGCITDEFGLGLIDRHNGITDPFVEYNGQPWSSCAPLKNKHCRCGEMADAQDLKSWEG